MRSKILTEHERHLLRVFLSDGIKQEGFKVLLHRMRKNINRIKDDVKLMLKVLEKLE
ncbi:MAG: hypothetical protein ACE5KD_04665 [Candidatus Bathyarchaeia archaeon]